jgi:putative Ca2+/H+ antiporter (TMEM165/GDT1 family)
MDSFLFCFLLVFAIGLGGRDQVIVARLSETLEQSLPLLIVGAICATISAAAMTFFGSTMAGILPQRAAEMLVAIALAFAAIELFWPVRLKPMDEPTRSLGAIGMVLLARQIGDGARFVIFAFAAEATYPATTVLGGALGGTAALALGWVLGAELEARLPLRHIRIGMGVCLILVALFIGLNARYELY